MFIASKVLWTLAAPANLLLALLVVGMALLWTRWRRTGRVLLSAAVICAMAVAVLPVGDLLLHPLEQRFAAPDRLPARIDGIIVLGGSVNPSLSASRGQPILTAAAERLTAGIELALRYPSAPFVFTGGSGDLFDQEAKEADAVGPMFVALGLPRERIILEDRSRNTYENAIFSLRLVKPEPTEVWLLVTSALHMPRAIGSFRHAGWDVVPYPVDYRTPATGARWWPASMDLAGSLDQLNLAVHEWLGLVAYWLDDRTASLLPAPRR